VVPVLLKLAAAVRVQAAEPVKLPATVLNQEKLRQYLGYFNRMEPEEVKSYVPTDWLIKNIPLFACP
jgi:hypothetical protein